MPQSGFDHSFSKFLAVAHKLNASVVVTITYSNTIIIIIITIIIHVLDEMKPILQFKLKMKIECNDGKFNGCSTIHNNNGNNINNYACLG